MFLAVPESALPCFSPDETFVSSFPLNHVQPLQPLFFFFFLLLTRSLRMPLNPLVFCSLSSLLVFSSPVLAQTTSLLPSAASDDHTFPSCASNCPLLQQAESSCIQNENANDHAASVSCFCQSGLIDQLHHSPNGTCDDTCTSISERDLLQTWYEEFCSSQAATNVKRDPTPAEEPADGGNTQTTTTSTGKAKPHYPAPPSWYVTYNTDIKPWVYRIQKTLTLPCAGSQLTTSGLSWSSSSSSVSPPSPLAPSGLSAAMMPNTLTFTMRPVEEAVVYCSVANSKNNDTPPRLSTNNPVPLTRALA